MSSDSTKILLKPFIDRSPAPMFMSSWFKTPAENFHHSETVEIDVQRDGKSIAIPLQAVGTGAQENANDQYTNKEFTPPVLNESVTIPAMRLLKRAPGESQFADLDFQARTLLLVANTTGKLTDKLQRTIELQSAQVLQTGTVTLVNQAGVAVFTLNYLPKNTHFVTPTAWAVGGGTGEPLNDLDSLADVIRTDGNCEPDNLVFGRGAWMRFLDNPKVQKNLVRDGLGLGSLKPPVRARNASFVGTVSVGAATFACWTYSANYDHPQTGTSTPYMAPNKVVMLSSQARLEGSFGAIPRFNSPGDQSLLTYIPQRISSEALSIDLTVGAYFTANRQGLVLEVGTRPLMIPVQIDGFGCLTVF
jgi:Phage major capsid protein E